MSWLGKVVGGAFGFLVGGPLGAVLGASVGHQFDSGIDGLDIDGNFQLGDRKRTQMAFFSATFSVMGHLVKADGRVTEAEINLARRVMDEMRLSGEMREAAINLFRQGKRADFPLYEVLDQLRRECHRRTNLIRMFMEIQIQAAYADGVLNPAEEAILHNICSHLYISRFEYEALKAQFQAQQRFESQGRQYRDTSVPRRDRIADAYAVLGLDANAPDTEIKKAYRRMMSQHHPDKLVAKGLPEEMMTLAKEKTQQIRKAYETIRDARGGWRH